MPRLFWTCMIVASLAGCGDGPQCAIDTDCPLGQRCAADGTCQLVGVGTDSGPDTPRDAGGEGGVDAGRVDSGAPDAGDPGDAGEELDATTPEEDGGGAAEKMPPAS